MLSVVIPALNAETTLVRTLAALVPGAVAGLVKEVVIADGGSRDLTAAIAMDAGARLIASEPGRGRQLAAGAAAARGDWLLFLHADTVLEPGWVEEVRDFIDAAAASGANRAGYFRFALDRHGPRARVLERIVAVRCALFRLPYGDQGLLVSRAHYTALGGFRPLELMEDVDMVRRIGRRRLKPLRTAAVTSAVRYRRHGYLFRSARNSLCLGLYFAGLPPRLIQRLYG